MRPINGLVQHADECGGADLAFGVRVKRFVVCCYAVSRDDTYNASINGLVQHAYASGGAGLAFGVRVKRCRSTYSHPLSCCAGAELRKRQVRIGPVQSKQRSQLQYTAPVVYSDSSPRRRLAMPCVPSQTARAFL